MHSGLMIHRGIVHTTDPITGASTVRIPALLGQQIIQVEAVDPTLLPDIGTKVTICSNDALSEFFYTSPKSTAGGGGGGGGGDGFVFNQAIPQATWVVDHPLTFIPNVTVVDSAGDVVEGAINYTTASRITLTFSGAFAGKAYLS